LALEVCRYLSFERLVGLQILDDEMYSQYREAMTPLLVEHGGGFRYDFKVNEVLKNEEGRQINRVFAIFFGDKNLMNTFFESDKDIEIRDKYFATSVEDATEIASYER
jgi:uncharacterized protein (DUF1330 family)